jgi:uncharacterized delta-60 repeat protein
MIENKTRRAFTRFIQVSVMVLVSTTLGMTGVPDGDIDVTFGVGGRVDSPTWASAHASAIQSDGKIIAAGPFVLWFPPGRSDTVFGVVRYNQDGSLDTTFGMQGIVTTDLSDRVDIATALAIQSDGKIIAAGQAGTGPGPFSVALVRYNHDGSLDMGFGIGGKVITDFSGPYESALALAIQSDGRIIAAGVAYASVLSTSGDFVLVRYEPDGSLDRTFGIDGKVTTDWSGGLDLAKALAILSDGRIVAAGDACISDYRQPCYGALARYNKDGLLDTTFGFGGKVTTDVLETSRLNALAVQSDGKIIAAGFSQSAESFAPTDASFRGADFGLVRYNDNGSLDTTFGSGGKVTTAFGPWRDWIWAVSLQPDGKIVAGGDTLSGEDSGSAFGLPRYNRDGSLDTSFGIGGKVKTELPPGRGASLRSLGIQRDGKIVALGEGHIENDPWFFALELARYNTTGLLLVSDVKFDQSSIGLTGSFSATLSGTNLTDRTYFDVRFRSPGSDTDQVSLNWQRGTSARHNISAGTTAGTWIVTGIRAHEDVSDHSGEFISVSTTLTVNSF